MAEQIAKDSRKSKFSHAVSGIGRRSFMQLLASNSALMAGTTKRASGSTYDVGVGYSSDPYTAASVALSASGQFPTNLAGQTVLIKPNLVVPEPSTSGTTTDPTVVKAIVDLCIAAGATQIQSSRLHRPENHRTSTCAVTQPFFRVIRKCNL